MANHDPRDDGFGPPKIPTRVGCLHCQQTYHDDEKVDPEDYEDLPDEERKQP